jgi:hypothetical protein
MAPAVEIIRSPEFAASVVALGGYHTPQMGRVLAEVGG